ncbi:16191_t:CDS:2 [Gigaspora margarita]|uniref:16191_t:CDS:1 n=1 Tax=Gigaspora margarita TaxID=4874 RepID=A0ABN7UWR5_GIGMA|nr:16191_t:CDS:2 [Gigaspora margarita]
MQITLLNEEIISFSIQVLEKRLKKEYILIYESLEEQPTMLSSMGGSSSSSSLLLLTTPTLQQAAAKQNLASNSMNTVLQIL